MVLVTYFMTRPDATAKIRRFLLCDNLMIPALCLLYLRAAVTTPITVKDGLQCGGLGKWHHSMSQHVTAYKFPSFKLQVVQVGNDSAWRGSTKIYTSHDVGI